MQKKIKVLTTKITIIKIPPKSTILDTVFSFVAACLLVTAGGDNCLMEGLIVICVMIVDTLICFDRLEMRLRRLTEGDL